MPVEGFDDASKKIKQSAVQRRKAARDASSKIRQAAATKREAKKAQKKAKQKEFLKYATFTEKRQSGRSGVNKDDIIARGKAAEAAKQAKKPATTQESLLNIKNEYVGFNPFKEANKTAAPKLRPKAKTVETKVKPATEIKAPAAKTKSKGYQRSTTNTGFTSAADRIKSKGVSNLKPTASKTKKGSYNFTEATGPNTSVFDKTKNVAPKAEEKAYQKKGTMGKGKAPKINAKPKKRAAKGSRAATLKKGFGY